MNVWTTAYVLSGKEGDCPLWKKIFASVNKAKIYAQRMFLLRGWTEKKSGIRWEIVTCDRVYLIERRKVKRDDLETEHR